MENISEEKQYYADIAAYLTKETARRSRSLDGYLVSFLPLGTNRMDLRSGVLAMLKDMTISDSNVEAEAQLMKDLFVDIAGIIYSKTNRAKALIICEVKRGELNLSHLSQLIGYSVCSNADFGLLIGVDGGLSIGFRSILSTNPHMLEITRVLRQKKMTNLFGICSWNYRKEELVFERVGKLRDISNFTRYISSLISSSRLVDLGKSLKKTNGSFAKVR